MRARDRQIHLCFLDRINTLGRRLPAYSPKFPDIQSDDITMIASSAWDEMVSEKKKVKGGMELPAAMKAAFAIGQEAWIAHVRVRAYIKGLWGNGKTHKDKWLNQPPSTGDEAPPAVPAPP